MDIVAVPHKLARITPDGVKLYSIGTIKVFSENSVRLFYALQVF